MRSSAIEAGLIAAEDNVAERHGRCAAGEEGAMLQEKRGDATVNFQDPINNSCAAAGEEGGIEKEEAKQACGKGPQIAGNFFQQQEDKASEQKRARCPLFEFNRSREEWVDNLRGAVG
jgi:hypothetical protein